MTDTTQNTRDQHESPVTATDALDLAAIRDRAYTLRWLAPGYAGIGRIRSATITDSDDLLALDRLIGVDVPGMADRIQLLREQYCDALAKATHYAVRCIELTQERDALADSINQRAGAR